ncbi:MAG TPA: sugar phosphate isomerase/epimerase [Vicinamibacterales bacterium]|nr:sugar phosphate isomerase/epimerase [Vicinamibacterales bacterium]
MSISRREFFRKTAAGAAGGAVLAVGGHPLVANPLGMPIGCQTWPVRAMIEKNVPGTLRLLADAGFQRIELCSPAGYAESGFAAFGKYRGPELRRLLGDLGLACESAHFTMTELRDDVAGRVAWAKEVGLTQMIVPTLGGPRNPTMDDVKRAAEEYNQLAAHAAKAGIQQGLHNEGFEVSTVDGRRTYDVLLELLDPELVKFQFQLSTIRHGFDAAEYFTKYPGRFVSMHLQDWSPEKQQTVAVGQGTIDWKKIFTAAKAAGVKNYFVELGLDQMKASVAFLRNLQV